jgi:hypothetical protein
MLSTRNGTGRVPDIEGVSEMKRMFRRGWVVSLTTLILSMLPAAVAHAQGVVFTRH